jgi:hypothetical protein
MAGQVCVDASPVLMLLLPHDPPPPRLVTAVKAPWVRWVGAESPGAV